MRLLLLISISLLLAWQAAHAQSADDYFNGGAHSYISNNIPQALVTVEKGLKQYPDDIKLKKLYELLKQQSKKQSKNKQSQQNRKNQSLQNKSQNKQEKQKQNQQKHQQPQNQSQKKKEENKQQHARSSAEQKQKKEQKSAKAAAAKQMSPKEARRLLDAQKDNEQFLQLKPKNKPRNPPAEDW